MILVTGGAGFIGSNVVAALNDAGRNDVVVCDLLRTGLKWQNLRKRVVQNMIEPARLATWLAGLPPGTISHVLHFGANSATTAVDGDDIMERNFRFSLHLLDWCTENSVPFIYASSAATYGDGAQGFADDWSLAHLKTLRPLNLYGWSKHLFDQVVADRHERGAPLPPVCIGLKFFNVFGPNEYHKGAMMSVISKLFEPARTGEEIQLFKSHHPHYRDGEQMRDFVYVDDVSSVILWLMTLRNGVGVFNLGSGKARTWLDLMGAMYAALGKPPKISFIDMPETLQVRYQYFTEADLSRLRSLGYNREMIPLEEAVRLYVTKFLAAEDRYR